MNTATSLLKALDVLSFLAGRGTGINMAEIAETLNLSRSTVVRVVNTLITYGLVEKRGKLYQCSDAFDTWARRDRYSVLKTRYRPVLEAIAQATGELVLLGVLEGNGIIHVDYIESDQQIRVAPAPNTRHNLYRNALGKLSLTRRPDLAVGVTSERLRQELEEIKATGVAWNREESVPGMVALAVPGFSEAPSDAMLAVAWPKFRFSEGAARTALAAATRAKEDHRPR